MWVREASVVLGVHIRFAADVFWVRRAQLELLCVIICLDAALKLHRRILACEMIRHALMIICGASIGLNSALCIGYLCQALGVLPVYLPVWHCVGGFTLAVVAIGGDRLWRRWGFWIVLQEKREDHAHG